MEKMKLLIIIVLLYFLMYIPVQAAEQNDFIFTFWPMYLGNSYNSARMEQMMDTGMTYAGVMLRPTTITNETIKFNQALAHLKSKGYKIALEISAGHYSWGGTLELATGTDDTKFLTAPTLDRSVSEYWNSIYAIDPSYTGFLWQNTLDNTYTVTNAIKPDLVLFDTEIWSNPRNVEWYFTAGDPGQNSNCYIVRDGIGYDAYLSEWKDRGLELVAKVKEASPTTLTSFYQQIPEGGNRWAQSYNGTYTATSLGYMPAGTADIPSPSLYILHNLELVEKNTREMDLSGVVPWVSFTYMVGYSNYYADGRFPLFDTSVSREAGRMLRIGGAKGFIVYPNAASYNVDNYWINHSREMIQGFLEGNSYVETNKIRNPGFESFKSKADGYVWGDDKHLTGDVRFIPVFWSWTDTNVSYNDKSTYANLTLEDKKSGVYAWRLSRSGDHGSRTILSSSFTISQNEKGNYYFSIWNKQSTNSGNGKIKFFIDGLSQIQIGEVLFDNEWSKFETLINLVPGEYKLKIVIEDSVGHAIDVLLDNVILCRSEYAEYNDENIQISEKIELKVYNNVLKSAGAQATIKLLMAEPGSATVKIYDSKGKEIITLWDGHKEAGVYDFPWDATDASGKKVGSGVYMVHLKSGSYTETKKIVVVK